jgi:hypothetical protein
MQGAVDMKEIMVGNSGAVPSIPRVEVRVAWVLALAVVAGTVAAELLPVVFGTGDRASWDWSFVYITLRFVLLPVVSVVDLLIIVPACLWRIRRDHASGGLSIAISGIVPLLFVLASYFYPIPWLP